MNSHKITNANIKEWAANYDGEPFDAILCDPPYELGFMGKSWDSSGIAFDKDMWADLFRHIKPGGHLLAFSGSRTYHRMAVAIEDAGFEIRDMIEWVYGSGFPKSLNIGKAVDKIQGNEREDLGFREDFRKRARKNGVESKDYIMAGGWKSTSDTVGKLDRGNTPFEGYGTALKPAHEPCVLARKPLEKGMTVATNALKHGTGGLNIDGARVGTEQVSTSGRSDVRHIKSNSLGDKWSGNVDETPRTGRFPANLIHDGSDEVEAVFPNSKGSKGSGLTQTKARSWKNTSTAGINRVGHDDNGSASRFFYCAKSSKFERNSGLDSTVSIKVQLEICENNITRQENLAQLQVVMDNSHLKATAESGIGTKSGTEWSMSLFGNQYTEKYPINTKSITKTTTSSITTSAILNYLTGLLTNESTLGAKCEMTVGGSLAESAENSNTLILTINGKTALALGVENVASPTLLKISVSDGKNFHSTVKPLSLTKYLATLIKPPTGGRLLVPFSGSGSEMIGALQAGWEYVEGVELTEEYIPIAEARIKYWLSLKEEESNQLELV